MEKDLLFDSEYSIDSLWKIGSSIWIPSSLSFVVPSSPGIVESFLSASLNDAKTIVTLTFCGSDFVSGPTHAVLLDGSNEVTSYGNQSVINSTHFTVSVAAGWTRSPSTVAYGQTYSLKSVSSSSSSFLVRSSISVKIPKAPCVTKIECDIDTSLTHFTMTFTGQNLPLSGLYTALLSLSASFEVTFSEHVGKTGLIEGMRRMACSSNRIHALSPLARDRSDYSEHDIVLDTSWTDIVRCSGMPSSTEYELIVADSEDSTQLTLDVSFTTPSEGSGNCGRADRHPQRWSINTLDCIDRTEIPVGSYEMNVSLVEDGSSEEITLNVSFSSKEMKIPKAPCVTKIECDIDTSLTHFVVKFTGQDLPLSGTYTARLMSSSASFEVTFLEGVGTSDPIEGNATNAGPTLSDVTCSLDSSDFNFVDLTLTGSGMPSSTEYELIVADSEDSTQLTLDVSFTTPSEGSGKVEVTPSAPIRIEGATADLLDDGTTVMITLRGVKLGEGSWMITVPTTPPQTVPGQLGEDGVVTFSLTADDSDASKLIFGLKYKIDTVTLNSTAVLVNDDVFFTVPRTALVSSGSFVVAFSTLGEYNVTLEPAFWTVVSFSSESLGESSEIEIGRSEGLKYSQQFTISLIVRTDDANDVIKSDQSIVLKTGSQPASAVFLVDSSGSSSPFCGDLARPCSSMDVGLSILSKVGIVQCEMKIVEKATQNKQHMVESGSVLSMSASSTISAELEIGASAWMASNSGLFVVSSARLEFHEIAVSIRRQEESFVLVRSLDPSSSSNVDTSDSPSSLCDWSTGLFVLSNCSTSIKLTEMTHLPQGAMNMKGECDDRSWNLPRQHAERRSLPVSSSEHALFGEREGGSWESEQWRWIDRQASSSVAVLERLHSEWEDVNINAPSSSPPSLRTRRARGTRKGAVRSDNSWNDADSDSSEGKSYPIDLAQQSFVSFTETNMTFTIARSSLSELDGSAEWRGRLKENVKKQQTAEANELDLDIEVLKMEDTSIATTDRVHASSFESPTQRDSIATGQKETKRPPESEEGEEDTKEERVMACGLDGKEVAVVNKYDTLFNRLHHPRAGLDVNKDVVRKQIVCALKSIVESGRTRNQNKETRRKAWKRHLIQEQELQMEHASNYQEMVEQNEKNEEGGLKEGGMGKKSERVVIEGDRWKAPEVVMGKKGSTRNQPQPASSDGRDRVAGAGGDDHAVSGLGAGESTDTFGTGECVCPLFCSTNILLMWVTLHLDEKRQEHFTVEFDPPAPALSLLHTPAWLSGGVVTSFDGTPLRAFHQRHFSRRCLVRL
ncbi:hypothetical protein BLNAU_25062 [Blattamonas nauphoetae]|uniref:Uncharacterized protein n=1 Tax=Blattamonas nauphoetae TaxID=2049346 RepID=A0ABQ9WPQ9_9EUKA|nr:hypothetical protein BLNAU_25062 [Blattamonas nauphoetae]